MRCSLVKILQILSCIRCERFLPVQNILQPVRWVHLEHWKKFNHVLYIFAELSMTLERKSTATISQLISWAGIKFPQKHNGVRQEGKGGVGALISHSGENRTVSNDGLCFEKLKTSIVNHNVNLLCVLTAHFIPSLVWISSDLYSSLSLVICYWIQKVILPGWQNSLFVGAFQTNTNDCPKQHTQVI